MSDEVQFKPTYRPQDAAFDGDCLTTTTGFDYDAVDRGNPLVAELTEASSREAVKASAELFHRVLQWAWMDRGQVRKLREATRRLTIACVVMEPGIFADLTYDEIGERLECTKANVSKIAIQFQKEINVASRRSRRKGQ